MAYVTPHTWTSEQATVALMNEINNNLKALFPVGVLKFVVRAATTAETFTENCWLECNGVSVLRATYPDLNTLLSGLSYPFGTADGTHMTLPDLQGRSLVSQASGGHANANAIGDSDGLAKASRAFSHTHTGPSHNHTGTTGGNSTSGAVPSGAFYTVGLDGHTHTFTTSTDGTGATGATSAPYLVAGVWLIKAVA